MKPFTTILLCLFVYANTAHAQLQLSGIVVDSLDRGRLFGATILLKEEGRSTQSGDNGTFSITTDRTQVTFIVSSVGYLSKEIQFFAPFKLPIEIELKRDLFRIDEVNVVSTGYQSLPKERATGSFEVIDNELLQRRVGTNLIDRMEDVTPGMVFNRNRGAASPINIRGQSGIFSNAAPLIVIDNFAYDGDINSINPNDVESDRKSVV